MSDVSPEKEFPPLKSLTKAQRRVLGTMVEKGITVPESYPLTVKALTTGCNQKSSRDPVTNYSEDDVLEVLDQLRELGLAAVVHTETGRTERYRHYVRRRMSDLSEPQVAILTELLLRGRQSSGDLRARASRMSPAASLDSLDQLRVELTGLKEKGLIVSDGSLDRRGIEIDHNLYEAHEERRMTPRTFDDEPGPSGSGPAHSSPTRAGSAAPSSSPVVTAPRPAAAPAIGADPSGRLAALESTCAVLRTENQELRADLNALREELEQLSEELTKLREALGA